MNSKVLSNIFISFILKCLNREGLATPWGIFVFNKNNYDMELMAHEEMHLVQMGRLVHSKFILEESFAKKFLAAILYSYKYLTGIMKIVKQGFTWAEAYHKHPFEIEAMEAQRHFKWGI